MCQRAPANDDYFKLYDDADVFPSVAERVIERGAEQVVPEMMSSTGLSREEAYLLFVFSAQGNLAANRLIGWRRGPAFDRAQELLRAYNRSGLAGVASIA